jgi:Asp-tRNA(Asn)/Glu-tRNA(Gln) amidotransferase A subunit family amidase
VSGIDERVVGHGRFVRDLLELPDAGPAGAATPEMLDEATDRLIATEPRVRAYVHVDIAGARAQLAAAKGPLAGVPFGVKDVIAVTGMPLGCGSALFDGEVAEVDATAVRMLREAGAVVVGKQVTHELTCGLDEPPTRNPWSLDSYPGGSSAGGGVSVAVGSARFALGTDAAGSVRIPAAMTGVVGVKPTWGRISHDGVRRAASAPSIDHVGILAPSVSVAAEVLEVTGGVEPGSPPNELAGVRVGVLTNDLHDAFGTDAAVLVRVDEAIGILEALGAELVSVEVPSLPLAARAIFTIFPVELALAHGMIPSRRPEAYSDGVRKLLELGAAMPDEWLRAARRLRGRLRRELGEVFARLDLDVLVTPTTPRVAMPLSELEPGRDLAALVAYTCPFNLTGQPAISVPCGFADDLPVGLQIVARPFDEATALAVAGRYEGVTDWHRRRPTVT